MKLFLPKPELLQSTGDVDYYHWNYLFPIKYIQRFRFKAILRLMANNFYDNLIEVGTGSGLFLPELSKHCRNLYAIDMHDKMDVINQLCENYSIEVELTKCSVEQTLYPDDMFDAIVMVSVLEFVDDLQKAMDELKRIMKPDGILLTICPAKSVLLDFILSLYTRRSPDEEFGNSRYRVVPMLETHFTIIEKKTFPSIIGGFFPIYQYFKLGK